MEDKVVAHFKDGRTQRGYTQDFRPDAELFHLLPSEGGGIPTTIRLDDLKALFHVKDYGSARRQVDRAKRFGSQATPGQRTIIEFKDGEKIWGLDRKSTRLNSSHVSISYAVFCLKKKKQNK